MVINPKLLFCFISFLIASFFFPVNAISAESYLFDLRWPSTDAYFSFAQGIAVDGESVYVIDSDAHTIKKFDSTGKLIIKWGGFGTGDGQLKYPFAAAIDTSGNIYIADRDNNRIQKFDSSGNYIAKWGSSGSGDGQFNKPQGIAIDSSGNIYVADTNNNRIQKFDSGGSFLAKWGSSGSGDGQFNKPQGIAVSLSDNVYVADTSNNRIQKFDSGGSFLAKWGSSGSGDGQFNKPQGISIDASGDVYVADTNNSRIQRFDSDGNLAAKWGSLGSGDGNFEYANALGISPSGVIYVASGSSSASYFWNQIIQKFDSSGTFLSKWSATGTDNGQFRNPEGVAVDGDGNVYVVDTQQNRIQKFTSDGTFLLKWGSVGSNAGQFSGPHAVAVDPSGNVYVADTSSNNRIQKFDSGGNFLAQWGSYGQGDGQFYYPNGIAADSDGNIYVADTNNNRIQKFDPAGNFVSKWGEYGFADGQFKNPSGVAVDSSGNVYVSDSDNNRIQKFDSGGNFIIKWTANGTQKIAVDSSGNVYSADKANHRIRKFDSDGNAITNFGIYGTGDGEFNSPYGVAVDSSGNVYAADTFNHRIQKFKPDGVVAGNADLAVSISGSAESVMAGGIITYTMSVINNGPDAATDVSPVITYSADVTVGSIISSQGVCGDSGNQVSCNLGTISSGTAITVTIPATFTTPGEITVTVSVSSNEEDTNISNNSSVITTTLSGQEKSLTVSRAGDGGGVIRSNDNLISCGNDCVESYPEGTEVTLSADPDLFSVFTGWSGDADCSDGIVTINGNVNCIATFNDSELLQLESFQDIKDDSGKIPVIRIDEEIPAFVDVNVPVTPGLPDSPVIKALDFLNRYRDFYAFGDPIKELYLKRIKPGVGEITSASSEKHLFFGQQKDGIPVYGSEIAVHLADDKIIGTNGHYLKKIPDFDSPSVTENEAETSATGYAAGKSVKRIGDIRLMYYNPELTAIGGGTPDPGQDSTHLAWRVMLRGYRNSDGTGTVWMYLVDANDGEILKGMDLSMEDAADLDLDINTADNTESDTCWAFTDLDEPWFDEDGPVSGYPGGTGNYPGGDAEGDIAFDNAKTIYNYFYQTFHRHSHDNDEEEVEDYIHVGLGWNNAKYDLLCDNFQFGDGYTVLDIMAHEFTHGVTSNEANLDYDHRSGALNESYSDVFGEFVEDWATGSADWLNGAGLPGGYGRNLSDPPDRNQPDHNDNYVDTDSDNGGVHTNSGIPNKAAYLISNEVQGGVVHNGINVIGIGREKAQWLYYKVLADRLTSNSKFMDARDLTVSQAQRFVDNGFEHLFVQDDVCSVINAFAAVGLGADEADVDCDGTPDNSAAEADDDDDSIPDIDDNCPGAPNFWQQDMDSDGIGNKCDDDVDGDDVLDDSDNCKYTANSGQEDADNDGIGDVCDDDDGDGLLNPDDKCPELASRNNIDTDNDGLANPCDPDDDDDGILDDGDGSGVEGDNPCSGGANENCDDNCQSYANSSQTDGDADGVGTGCDNCVSYNNPGQDDYDHDGKGDICDTDDDGDGVADNDDLCSNKADPDQFDFDGNGIGSACDIDEAEKFSDAYGGFFDGTMKFPTLSEAIKLPIFPCVGGTCPDYLSEDFMTEVTIELPADMPARIVDDRGFVVKRGKPGVDKSFFFHPASDYFYRFPESSIFSNMSQSKNVRVEAVVQSAESGTFNGRNYYLEILPTASVQAGQNYPFKIKIKSGTDLTDQDTDNDGISDSVDNCPNVSNGDQKDTDGDSIGDACEEVVSSIELSYFKVKQSGKKVYIRWATKSETDNKGFNVWKSTKIDGKYSKVNGKLISSKKNASSGAKYSYRDSKVKAGKTYYYKLQSIDKSKKSIYYDPVKIKIKGKKTK